MNGPGSLDDRIRRHIETVLPDVRYAEAIEAVLDLHKPARVDIWIDPARPARCLTCRNFRYPCPTVRAVARALGVEHDNPATTGGPRP